MDLRLASKRAVVTAASKGIGREIALGLAAEGASVAICARGEADLRKTEGALRTDGVPVFAQVCDVGQPGAVEGFLEAAREALGGIDILVNNATGYGFKDDEEAWRSSLDVDLMATVRACWKVVPWMKDAGSGAIVHISSIAGLYANPSPAYAAAKAAVISHSKSLAIELAPNRIRVNVVCPGSIFLPDGLWDRVRQRDAERFDEIVASIPSGRMGHPQEVADTVVFLCSERASWITGACLVVDGGQYRGTR
jgi:NAD(P)-dependent dehydrogenase (short-subunit alcohol dehydrogenase family)